MRIEAIELSWFRGAARRCVLSTELKNVVVYGANGSGKSSFVDAIEYILMNGKIKHLKHEYSGTRQEKGVRNTHAPPGTPSTIGLRFEGGVTAEVRIAPAGAPSFSSDPADLVAFIQSWQLERLTLRQDEVANFVHETKGGKYSVLLPLLGLENLETAAENLHKLRQIVSDRGKLAEKTAELEYLGQEAKRHFPDLSKETAINALRNLARTYLEGGAEPGLNALAQLLSAAIERRIASASPEITRCALLKQIRDESLSDKMAGVTVLEGQLRGEVDALLDSRIGVLEEASGFAKYLDAGEEAVECPACGRLVRTSEFVSHVSAQLRALQAARSTRNKAKAAREALGTSLRRVLGTFKDDAVSAWLACEPQRPLKEALSQIARIDPNRWVTCCPAGDMTVLEGHIPAVDSAIRTAIEMAPPLINKLLEDKKIVEASLSLPRIETLQEEGGGIRHIVRALEAGEAAVRNHTRSRTAQITRAISSDVQALWSKLHPGEPIEGIRLYVPRDADRAIDVGLKFHGVEQPSPRLTLSEGHRNSLGLCIFLALTCVDKGNRRPILLDDIVSSLDREHRGMLARVLTEDLAERQVLLFTHEREWFQELRAVLPAAGWKFMALKPWTSPETGLQWSTCEDTFDDARSLIDQNAKAAGNCVRAIMDSQFAIAAEKLRVSMPYARGDRNDHRTCVEFLDHLMSEAKQRLRKQDGESWQQYLEPVGDWEKARALLVAWADRASHTGSLVPNEVEQLIQVCRDALAWLKCGDCGDYIWVADQASRKRLQCACGRMQWRYG